MVVPICSLGNPSALATVMLTGDPGVAALGDTETMAALGTRKMKDVVDAPVSWAEMLVTTTPGLVTMSAQPVGWTAAVMATILVPLTEMT